MPMMDGMDSPTAPLYAPEPMEPLAPEFSKQDSNNNTLPEISPVANQDEFDFFQPGAQLPDLPPLPTGPIGMMPDPTPAVTPVEIAEPSINPHKRPLSKRFNYKIQRLPSAIYSDTYDAKNRHLPVAQHEAQYDYITFAAAAGNNLDGLRAMIEHGGRSLEMRNAQGQTLVEVATQYRAHATLRYLLAIGAPQGAATPADAQSHYALNAAR